MGVESRRRESVIGLCLALSVALPVSESPASASERVRTQRPTHTGARLSGAPPHTRFHVPLAHGPPIAPLAFRPSAILRVIHPACTGILPPIIIC